MPQYLATFKFGKSLNFDARRIRLSQRYELLTNEEQKLEGIKMSPIDSVDQAQASNVAKSELEGLLALIALHCFQMPEEIRSEPILEITQAGLTRPAPLPTSISLSVKVLPLNPVIDLDWFAKNQESDEVKALGMFRASNILWKQGLVPESCLSYYLTLEMLLGEKALRAAHTDFWHLRNGLVHTKLDNKSNRKFLLDNFGSECPSWRIQPTFYKLAKYTGKLEEAAKDELLRRCTK